MMGYQLTTMDLATIGVILAVLYMIWSNWE